MDFEAETAGSALGCAEGTGVSSSARASSTFPGVRTVDVVSGSAAASTGKDPDMSSSSDTQFDPVFVAMLICATVFVAQMFPALTLNSTAIFCKAARSGAVTDCNGA